MHAERSKASTEGPPPGSRKARSFVATQLAPVATATAVPCNGRGGEKEQENRKEKKGERERRVEGNRQHKRKTGEEGEKKAIQTGREAI